MSVDGEVAFAGAARIAEMVRAKDVSPSELVDLYLERNERIKPERTRNARRSGSPPGTKGRCSECRSRSRTTSTTRGR
jgi:Asp-tRNA(Asn)/Glu-tRNA(Gln) amidotransferase A subunit family amidase